MHARHPKTRLHNTPRRIVLYQRVGEDTRNIQHTRRSVQHEKTARQSNIEKRAKSKHQRLGASRFSRLSRFSCVRAVPASQLFLRFLSCCVFRIHRGCLDLALAAAEARKPFPQHYKAPIRSLCQIPHALHRLSLLHILFVVVNSSAQSFP